MRTSFTIACLLLLGTGGLLFAKDDTRLKDALKDNLVTSDWIYEDVDAGYAEAKKTGKPLLVSFRCVP